MQAARYLMVAEKNGNRGKRWTLQVCEKGFADGTFFGSEAECLQQIAMLQKELPHFVFDLCKKEDFIHERTFSGPTYVFRK
jgi:hypothetical protein